MKWFRRILLLVVLVPIVVVISLHFASEVIIHRITQQAQESALFDVQTLLVNDIEWAYREYNSDQEDTIVFVHGFMGSSFDFHAFNLDLAERLPLRIIAVDLPGFGLSEKSSEYRYTSENHALELRAFLEALNIDQYHLVGHSMGGNVVKRHTALFESSVLSLILIAAAGLDEGPSRSVPPVWFYDLIFTNYFAQRFGVNTATVEPLTRAQFHPYIILNAQIPGSIIQQFSIDQDDSGTRSLIGQIETRTLILYGEQDAWTPPSLGQQMHALMPNSQLVLLSETGHLPYLENPRDTLSEIVIFLNHD